MHEAPHEIELVARHHLQELRAGATTRPRPTPGRGRRSVVTGLRRLADRIEG